MLETLQKHWGYSAFRPLQAEIISSILDGEDVLALLPTGAGKSLCFQLPALMQDGLCLVITPLISLMLNQVESLKSIGVNAVAIHSGMRKREIDIVLDNAIYGNTKFLYVSPERIFTEIFLRRLEKFKIFIYSY